MTYIITVDVGTMSMRTAVYDTTGSELFQSSFEYQAIFLPQSLVEQDPSDWKRALEFTLSEVGSYVVTSKISVSAISVTSQRASVFPVDASGNPLFNAVTWQDKRSLEFAQQLVEEISLESIYQKTGLRANPYFSLPKMMWFKQKKADIYRRTHKLIGVQDYIIYLLTNQFKTDWTQAARTMLLNISTFEWDQEMLDVSGMDEALLCDLQPPGSIAGGLTSELAMLSGLSEGIPVIMAGGDQQSAALALNNLVPRKAVANTGTGSFVIAYSDHPVFDQKCRVLCSASAVPGKWIIEAGIFNTGSIYRWFRNQFYSGEEANYAYMNDEAEHSPVGANGVIMIPHFEGSAAPFWNPYAKGLFFNLSLGSKRGDLARSVFEGIALEIVENIRLLEAAYENIDTVSVAGGMTRSRLFNQIQADVFNMKIVSYKNSEASSLGALMSAAVTLGVFGSYEEAFRHIVGSEDKVFLPEASNHAKYGNIRLLKLSLYEALNQSDVYEKFLNSF